MRKSFTLPLAVLSLILSTSALAHPNHSSSVICPPIASLTCTNSGDNSTHFYNSNYGVPAGNWTSNFYQNGPCPSFLPSVAFPVASVSDAGARVLCTYHSAVEVIQIFQTSAPTYCEEHFLCSPRSTRTSAWGCVKYGESSCSNP